MEREKERQTDRHQYICHWNNFGNHQQCLMCLKGHKICKILIKFIHSVSALATDCTNTLSACYLILLCGCDLNFCLNRCNARIHRYSFSFSDTFEDDKTVICCCVFVLFCFCLLCVCLFVCCCCDFLFLLFIYLFIDFFTLATL